MQEMQENQEIPDILIPKDEPESLPQMDFKDAFINNNIGLIIEEKTPNKSVVSSDI